ncbi:MAG: iron ABC transporter permease [Reyranella sp.]|uniref:ABC transporter permease n=1 Tax=Reyranella sp. TaxID=1929291 RepID=UPI001AD34F0E|nr:iron ABC transporter permease [Reyranella sp.]MBN9087004.1 iron ABC transporter permease [Reyranella sp.]
MAVQAEPATAVPVARRRRRGQLGWVGGIAVTFAALAALYLVMAPLLALLSTAFRGPSDLLPFEPGAHWTVDNLLEVYLGTNLLSTVLPSTAIFVLGSVVVTFFTAFTLAWLVERTDLPWRTTIFTVILFPLLVPGIVMAFAWTLLFAPNAGWVNVALRALLGLEGNGPIDIFSMAGLILCQGIASVPFVFLLLGAAMRTMNPSLEEASSASGARPITTFFRVTLPVLRPGVLAPLILAILVALEQFEMPLIIGFPARINVFSTRLYFDLNPEDELPAYGKAAAVALLFLVAAIALLLVYNHLIRRAERFVTVTGKGYRPTRYALGRWRVPALAFVGFYLLVAALLPAVVLVWTSFAGGSNDVGLDAYRTLLADNRFWPAVRNTFVVAGLSAGLITLIGALLAWQILRLRFPGRAALDVVSFLSIGIPAVITGFAVMILHLTIPIGIYGTVWILVLAYSYRLAVSTRLSRAALIQIHPELEEASIASGGRWLDTIGRVVLPLLAPSLMASFLLLFIVGFREFTIPMILQSQDNWVLSVIMWKLQSDRQTAQAAAVGTMILLFVAPVIFVLRRQLLSRQGDA